MHWIKVKAGIAPELGEAAEEALMAAGALAVTFTDAEDQPLYEPERGTTPLWQNSVVDALFDADTDVEQLKRVASEVFQLYHPGISLSLQVEILENEDWTRKWLDSFKPIKLGRRLWVCPNWYAPPEPAAVNLRLDPGLAFGTGTHPTTALCLKWLDGAELTDKQVIDYGCGSGILGIAALLLGARTVCAVDNDPQALLATQTNAAQNGLSNARIQTWLPDQCPEHQTDLILANILAEPLRLLKATLCQRLIPGGQLVMSGVLERQAESLMAHYSDCIRFEAPVVEEGWVRLCGRRS
jgi:ribosomal protein L11 methyltransferase